MGRKNKEIGQSSMFDISGEPTVNYGTTAEDVDKILKSIPAKKVVEPTVKQLVDNLKKPEITEKIDSNSEIISVSVPFDFYDTGVVDAIFTRKKYTIKSCIEFYFHVLDGDTGYRKFINYLPHIEKYFSRFFGWNGDKELLRKDKTLKNRISNGDISRYEKQDRTNQFMKVLEKIKGISYDRGYIYTGDSRFTKGGLSENKDKFISYPHEEWQTRLMKWMNGEEYDYPSPQGNIIEEPTEIVKGNIITEIEISRNASFDEEKGLHGKVPFFFLNTGLVDHRKTIGEYTLKDCIVFYLKVVRKESHYGERFSKLLPNIKKYFVDYCKWDGNIETLEKYLELISKISKDCKDEIIISLSGGLDVAAMYNKFGNKKTMGIIDNILKSKAPFDDILLYRLLHQFFENIHATDEINSIEKNKDNLIRFFGEIIESLTNNGIGDKIYEFGENIWKSYEKILDIIFKSFGKVRQDENKWKLVEEDKYEFEDWFDENYPYYEASVKNSIWQLLTAFEYTLVRDIREYDFLVAMFASYMKKGMNAEIVDVYKRNLIGKHLKGGGHRTIERQGQHYEIKGSTNISYGVEFFEKNNYTFDEFGNRIWKEEDLYPGGTPGVSTSAENMECFGYGNNIPLEEPFSALMFDGHGYQILDDEEIYTRTKLTKNYSKTTNTNGHDSTSQEIGYIEEMRELGVVDRLIKILELDGLLKRFEVNKDKEFIVDKQTGSMLSFEEIFKDEEYLWKINILERSEKDGDLRSIKTNYDYSPLIIGLEPKEKLEDDDSLPF